MIKIQIRFLLVFSITASDPHKSYAGFFCPTILSNLEHINIITGTGNISNNSSNLNSGLSSGLGLTSGGSGNGNQSSFGRSSGDSYNPNAPVTYPTNYGGAAR